MFRFLVIALGGIFLLASINGISQNTTYIKVHFLYGSKPLNKYRQTEHPWFGGILGGHVGIEADSNRILNFVNKGKFHVIPDQNAKHSMFTIDSVNKFYSRLGGQHPDSAKQAIIIIPVTPEQKRKFDSIAVNYLNAAPYDYALIGMRCGAAAYDILAQLGIVRSLSRTETSMIILYPKKLRKILLAKAKDQGWMVLTHNGTCHRKWETDD